MRDEGKDEPNESRNDVCWQGDMEDACKRSIDRITRQDKDKRECSPAKIKDGGEGLRRIQSKMKKEAREDTEVEGEEGQLSKHIEGPCILRTVCVRDVPESRDVGQVGKEHPKDNTRGLLA